MWVGQGGGGTFVSSAKFKAFFGLGGVRYNKIYGICEISLCFLGQPQLCSVWALALGLGCSMFRKVANCG